MKLEKPRFSFYVFGMTYAQDLIPVMLKSIEKGADVWFCFFDCVYKKRHFYYYEKNELIEFIKNVCKKHKLSVPKIDFYGLNDEELFKSDYKLFQPDVVFLQVCKHKYAKWLPSANNAKVVNFPFHFDLNEKNSSYNIDLNVVGKKEYVKLYDGYKFKTVFFGDIKLDHIDSIQKTIKNFNFDKHKNRKVCFIPGTHLRFKKDGSYVMGASKTLDGLTSQGNADENYDSIEFVKQTIKYLKSKGFFVYWKEREKGYPKGKHIGWDNVLNYIDEKPDVIINKDLNYPSALMYIPFFADITIVFNFSSVKYTIGKITNRIINIDTNNDFEKEMKKISDNLKKEKIISIKNSNVSEKIVNCVFKELL